MAKISREARQYIRGAVVDWISSHLDELWSGTDCYVLEVSGHTVTGCAQVPLSSLEKNKVFEGHVLIMPLYFMYQPEGETSYKLLSVEEYNSLDPNDQGYATARREFELDHELCACRVSWTGNVADLRPTPIF